MPRKPFAIVGSILFGLRFWRSFLSMGPSGTVRGVRGTVPAPRRAALSLTAILLLLSFAAPAQNASPREVRMQANNALVEGAYDQAIGFLMQLIEWYKNSRDRETVVMMEEVYYNLGLCYYLTGQFPSAEKAFKEFLRRYPKTNKLIECEVYTADGYRFQNNHKKAISAYERILSRYEKRLTADWRADVLCSLVRCHLAQEDWKSAIPRLEEAYRWSPDSTRRNWAATLLTTAYLKEQQLEKVYDLVPFLLQPDSFAARSVAFNLIALEISDGLFADEKYRDSLFIYRLVYPRERIKQGCEAQLAALQKQAEAIRRFRAGRYRQLLRIQEQIGETEAELEALNEVQDYAFDLRYRMCRAYYEIRRYYESRDFFLYLHGEAEDDAISEECLFLAFDSALQLRPWDRAFEIGFQYMATYPAGEYYDPVSLTIGQMYARQKKWPKVIDHLTTALQVSPKHQSGAECMFLIGYACFMEERYAETVEWMDRMNQNYPNNDRAEEGSYWAAMGLLFDTKYETALERFGFFMVNYPGSHFIGDATYRHAVCLYGLSRFREAEREFLAFVERFRARDPDKMPEPGTPEAAQTVDDSLIGEAYMMMADIAGNFGELEIGVQRYKSAIEHKINIELYNYCTFRCVEMLKDLNDWDGVIAHLEPYIETNADGYNVPMAVYWVGQAYWQKEDHGKAIAYFLKSIRDYGKQRDALGIDLIVEEWIGRTRSLPPERREVAWEMFEATISQARDNREWPLVLRLQRAFLYKPGISEAAKEQIYTNLLKEVNLPYASPGVLELIMDEATRRNLDDLAYKAAMEIVEAFPETDYVIGARMLLGQRAVDQEDYDAAEAHYQVIIQYFAANQAAAEALYQLADVYLRQAELDLADDAYKRILGVREWRGPLWPAALHGRGNVAMMRRDYRAAAAYFERIYVMYSSYRTWTAKAYVSRAKALTRIREPRKAVEVLQEMLGQQDLAELPEAEEARQLLAKMGETAAR